MTITTEASAQPVDAPTSSAVTKTGHPVPVIAVARHKYYSGQASWLWTYLPGSPPPFEIVPLCEALEAEYATDAHFVACIAFDVSAGRDVYRQPRLKKDDLQSVRGHGFELRHHVLVADVDSPGHKTITRDQIESARAKLSGLTTIGWYTSRAGLRILQPLASPITPEHYEAIVPGWLDGLQKVLGNEWVVDRQCQDWTRHFRLPRVIRDGKPSRPEIHIDAMAAVAAPGQPPPARRQGPTELQRLVTRLSTGTSNTSWKIERARKYVAAVPTPDCGTSQCSKTAFRVACILVRQFYLSHDDALVLLAEWAGRGFHKWKPSDLERKVRDARAKATDGRVQKVGPR